MVAPSAQKSGTLRLAVQSQRRAVPVPSKLQKTTFFVNQSTFRISGMAPGGNQCATRRFLLFQKPQHSSLHLRTSTHSTPTILVLNQLTIQ